VRTILCLSALYLFCSSNVSAQSTELPSHELFAGTGEGAKNENPYRSGQPSGKAVSLKFGNPFGIEIGDHALWITTVDDHCIYRCELDGSAVSRIAGTGVSGYSGDGGPAEAATFNWPHEVRADSEENLYVADTRNHVIRRIDAGSGIITTLAGSGDQGFAGDGLSGDRVQFKHPHSVVLDGAGGLLVADTANHRLRRIDLDTGKVQTISGTGRRELPTDGQDAANASLFGPRSLAVDGESIWIALREGNSIWRIDRATNRIHHVAGTGKKGYSGDGGPAREATFSGPKGLVMDGQRRLLVVDTENHALRRIDLERDLIETVLGGSAAEQTLELKRPHGIDYAAALGYLIADSENHRVLRGQER
jgi:sugar lactone lactonase YvrE